MKNKTALIFKRFNSMDRTNIKNMCSNGWHRSAENSAKKESIELYRNVATRDGLV